MFKAKNLNTLSLIALLTLSQLGFADKLSDQRSAFLLAEKFLTEKNENGFIEASAGLTAYPLYPYLRYLAVKEQLSKTDQILAFLTEYKDSRYAPLLRSKWLGYLAEQGRWSEFLQHYVVDEQSAGDCRYQWARYQTGNHDAAFIEAKQLWLAGKPAENECLHLFKAFEQSAAITPALVWQRFESALDENEVGSARSAALLLKGDQNKLAENWLLLHDKPESIESPRYLSDKSKLGGKRFIHAIKRLKNKDLEKAISLWDANSAGLALSVDIRSEVERRFGMALLGKKDSRAFDRLNKVVNPDEETRTAKVRAALLEQNWPHVQSALAGLTPEEKNQPQWQYWAARALEQTGRKQQAETAFKALSEDRSYYGFLAADTIKSSYNIKDFPVKFDSKEVASLAEAPDFIATHELKILGRDIEARRQWQFAIKNLAKEKLLAAAKLAEQWGLDQLAITTLVKADYWDDMALRFPIRYLEEVTDSAGRHNLDAPLIYGVMRQESMLDKDAVSSAGAMGLMQLMPETAKKVAKALNEPWQSNFNLYKPEVNIHYGTYYFKDLLQRFGNHVAVTSAAYNAGPNRALKWLPAVASVPADIWIETIPYKETRKYVSSVLAYAMIYQQRLKKNGLKLKGLLTDVPPVKNLG
jgi:soluble lytic murein transglycosylase